MLFDYMLQRAYCILAALVCHGNYGQQDQEQ
jgi:hypothetical protein